MLEALSSSHNRRVTLIWLAVCAACSIGAAVVGISDNPPGILLAFAAAAAVVLAVVHPWRTSRRFRMLFIAAGLGLIVFGLLHGFLEVGATRLTPGNLLRLPFEALGVAFFLLAVLVCPPALVVGAVGAVVMAIRNRRRKLPRPTTTG